MEPSECGLLIVDDEHVLRESMVKFFKRKKFNVYEAEDGVQALDCLKKGGIHYVLSDIGMPNMDGHKLLQEILKLSEQKPKFIYTSGDPEFTKDLALSQGASNLFVKPVERKDILAYLLEDIS